MRNKNLKLSIQEIADLKEGRKTLEEIEKTHDGTSMSHIKPIIEDFIKENVPENNAHNRNLIADENGKILNTAKYSDVEKGEPWSYKGYEDHKNLHFISNKIAGNLTVGESGSGRAYEQNDGSTMMPHEEDFLMLTQKNNDGEYLFRSCNLVSGNGTVISLLRNNQFNQDNENALAEVMPEYKKATRTYFNEYNDKLNENYNRIKENKEYPSRIDGHEIDTTNEYVVDKVIMDMARRQTINDVGTFEDVVLEKSGLGEKLETECNIKVRSSRKNTVKLSPFENYDEYDWAEIRPKKEE